MSVYVIGDVVRSREHPDPRRMLADLGAAVRDLAHAHSAAPTTGDEFQATYHRFGAAVRDLADLRLRLATRTPTPVALRLGLGLVVGADVPADAGAPGQSDPGWWHARSALDTAGTDRRAWPRVSWWVEGEGDVTASRAVLVALDSLLQRFDALDMSLARGLLAGSTARQLAGQHAITPQSVAQRLHDHGVYGWVRTIETLDEEP